MRFSSSCRADNLEGKMVVRSKTSHIVTTLECSNDLVSPEISDFARIVCFWSDSSCQEINKDSFWLRIWPVDNQEAVVTSFVALERLVDFNVSSIATLHAFCLLTKRILININQILVADNAELSISHFSKVITKNKWRFDKAPESEMRSLFKSSQDSITDLKHVWIIPATRTSNLRMLSIPFEVFSHWRPFVFNIISSSPAVANILSPFPGLLFTPVAYWIVDGSTRFL